MSTGCCTRSRSRVAGQYPVRILVSRQYLRFDDNYDASDFLLLDRRTRTLFSVSHEERSILVIDSQSGDASLPADIVLTEERVADGNAPKIAGQSPLHVRFRANDELCYEAFVIPGVQQEMTAALTEYLQLVGLRLLQTLDTVPKAMQTPCFLSRYVYRPATTFAGRSAGPRVGCRRVSAHACGLSVKNNRSRAACLYCRMATAQTGLSREARMISRPLARGVHFVRRSVRCYASGSLRGCIPVRCPAHTSHPVRCVVQDSPAISNSCTAGRWV